MIQSTAPRAGLAPPSQDNGPDPIHGREWDTLKDDLQYACTFDLPTPRDCIANDRSCDCNPERVTFPPLCSGTRQVKGKAYPTIRPLRVVQGLGSRGVVGSICSKSYDATMTMLVSPLVSRSSAFQGTLVDIRT